MSGGGGGDAGSAPQPPSGSGARRGPRRDFFNFKIQISWRSVSVHLIIETHNNFRRRMITSFFKIKNWHHEGGGERYSIYEEETRLYKSVSVLLHIQC